METINWYPGHMKKTRELVEANLKLVDAVLEVCDARIPVSSRNPILGELTARKDRILILNKRDLADAAETTAWIDAIRRDVSVRAAVAVNCMNRQDIAALMARLEKIASNRNRKGILGEPAPDAVAGADGASGADDAVVGASGATNAHCGMHAPAPTGKRPFRLMVVGIPNAGKSSLINRLTGRRAAQVGDRPGVTRGKQWLTLSNGMHLLDTPGILWPKFEDPAVGLNLALCGSIPDTIMDVQSLGLALVKMLWREHSGLLAARYGLEQMSEARPSVDETLRLQSGADAGAEASEQPLELTIMEKIAQKRGFLLPGKRVDWERTAKTVLDEFRAGKIGRVTLEKSPTE
jgi:ribosome biogenesis GTPase A